MKEQSFWMQVITELKNRGVQDIFIACVDGLKGFPEAIEAVFPQTQVQVCIVHLVRHSLFYISHRDRKEVAQDLKLNLLGYFNSNSAKIGFALLHVYFTLF